jgi:hypothetical protein
LEVWSKFCPTASQESVAVHQTAVGEALTPPLVGCSDQEVPSHIAAFSPGGPPPTASQKLADRQESELTGENPGTLGPADHADPFQISTAEPAADMQKFTAAQDNACGSTSGPGRS